MQVTKIKKAMSYQKFRTKQVVFLSTFLLAIFSSCMEKNLYEEATPGNSGPVVLPGFSFKTKTDKSVTVYAISNTGQYTAGVPVSVYTENPYNEDGIKQQNIFAKAYGHTDTGGALTLEVNVPNSVTKLYILPEISGFGPMQEYNLEDNSTINLCGPQIGTPVLNNSIKIRSTEEEYSTSGTSIGTGFNIYQYISFDSKGIPQNGNFVSNDPDLTLPFLTLVNKWYPEKQNIANEEYYEHRNNTDLLITGEYGTEVWVTYIGDGGFSNAGSNANINNMLCYYQYPDGEMDNISTADIQSKAIRKTVIFSNTNQRTTPAGKKVQLLYWDGEKYIKDFPKGVRIGWVMIQQAFDGYKLNKTTLNNIQYYRFSTGNMNQDRGVKDNQVITRWCEEFNCNIAGVENRIKGKDKAWDGDYNDVLFKITATPKAKPTVDVPPIGEDPGNEDGNIEECKQYGTLAFEDMHPSKGDWDHNDFVADYTYSLEYNKETGKVCALAFKFDVRALGAGRKSGFGIELPISISDVAVITGAKLEDGQDKATVILYENTRDAFGGREGIINTMIDLPFYPSEGEKAFRITLKKELNKVLFSEFNPFLFVDTRDNETHLPDYRPTKKGSTSSFGVNDDKSDGITTFYRTDERHAWGLDIVRDNADSPGWVYPVESIDILDAYLNYSKWVESENSYETWYKWTIPENVNKDKLYIREN